MKLNSVLVYLLLGYSFAYAQEASDGLESLSLPGDESNQVTPSKTELSLPSGSTATSTSGVGKKENVGAILDFEGEVIEGERRRPDLFLQISIDNIKFDSLIYNRDDFNDYLEVDRKSRTRFLKMK